jgi:hypothetical protein
VNEKWNIWLPVAIMIVFASTRWPGMMPENFSAAYALAFCAGVYFPPRLRWILPLGTLFLCDLALNAYYAVPLLDGYTIVKVGAFAALIWLGQVIGRKASWAKLTGGGILGACIFYLVTNFASWLYDPAYPKTLAGLIQALTIGTPGWPHTWEFFRNTLLSGGLFTGLFCGAMKLGEASEAADQEEEEETKEERPSGEEAPA